MSEIEAAIVKIHATPHKSVLAVAGAGSSALSWLLSVSGASRTLLETRIPYGRLSMIDLVGREPEQYVSTQTAREMAQATYRRGLALREDDSPVVGLACTATIATDRPKRGDHRACLALWDAERVVSYNLVLEKGKRDRVGEEEAVSRLIVQALAQAFGLEVDLNLGLTDAEQLEITVADHPGPVKRLLSGAVDGVIVRPSGLMTAADLPLLQSLPKGANEGGLAVLPGSFNPLHYGHRQLARIAGEMLGREVVYELSVANVDKPPLAAAEIQRRAARFVAAQSDSPDGHTLVLTRAPTFREKADLFPGCVIIIGWDTLVRLLDPKYYGGREDAVLTALAEIWALGCRFLVAGRQSGGTFRTLAEIAIPLGFQPLFQAIPETSFRADVSSTELRERR